jgi:CRISPR-associated endonuclease/helicase Cas3
VFFCPEQGHDLEWVAYQPLENHVGNVVKLMSCWRTDKDTFDLAIAEADLCALVKGAEYHDWGKTQKFAIRKEDKGWTYTYAGHRFLNPADWHQKAEHDQEARYHLTLERAHHDYSVQEIIRDAYDLKQKEIANKDGVADYRKYPQHLFVLEMCDQIEAEVAVMAIEGKEVGRNSSFMEFEVSREQDAPKHKVFTLEPYPFAGEVNYDVTFRKDDVQGQACDAKTLTERGFTDYEPLERINITLKPKYAADEVGGSRQPDLETFYQTASQFSPNALQREVWEQWQQQPAQPAGLIVKAPTGVGKTEACVYPPLAQGNRVVLVLPAKALVDDHKKRLAGVLQNLSTNDRKKRRLLVDTGDEALLQVFTEKAPEATSETTNRKKDTRHLYRADVIITTLDKFLYRFFGFGGGKKSYTYPLRIGDTSRMAFIFDEAHSYEGTAFTNFQRLVTTLYDNKHNIVLMTATLPEKYQLALQDPEDFGMPGRWEIVDFLRDEKQTQLSIGKHNGKRHLTFIADDAKPQEADPEDPESFEAAKEAFDKHKKDRIAILQEQLNEHWSGNERIIVTLDRVQDAAELYTSLAEESGYKLVARATNTQPDNIDADAVNLFLYHGRLDRDWRSKVYGAVKTRDEHRKPYVLVSTSAIEIGVDLDADVLITEVCNPDSLVQRMGRCNRRGEKDNAKVVVVGSHIPAYLDAFGEDEGARTTYIDKLEQHHQQTIDKTFSYAIMAAFPKPVLTDPRAATAYDMLYKYVYEFALEYQNLHDLGFIATRSFEPTVDVRIPVSDDAFDVVTMSVGRMSRHAEDAAGVRLERYVVHRDKDKSWRGQWELVTSGGDLYKGSYRVELLNDSQHVQNYRRDVGLVDIPQIFQRSHWRNDPPLKYRLKYSLSASLQDSQTAGGVLHIPSKDDKKGKSIVLTYLADPELHVGVF